MWKFSCEPHSLSVHDKSVVLGNAKKKMPVKAKADDRKIENKKNKVKLDDGKRKKLKRVETWSTYVYKILRGIHQDEIGISRKSMQIMNEFIDDMFNRIAFEASLLLKRRKKRTMLPEDIEAGVRLIIPRELCFHALSEGKKAIQNYYHSPKFEE